MTTTVTILARIGHQHLSLYRGEGYWYFSYDDGGSRHETRSVMVLRLSHLSLDQWVAEGRALVALVEEGG
jgi:hypothetical protein